MFWAVHAVYVANQQSRERVSSREIPAGRQAKRLVLFLLLFISRARFSLLSNPILCGSGDDDKKKKKKKKQEHTKQGNCPFGIYPAPTASVMIDGDGWKQDSSETFGVENGEWERPRWK
jgi:hypothetical protein